MKKILFSFQPDISKTDQLRKLTSLPPFIVNQHFKQKYAKTVDTASGNQLSQSLVRYLSILQLNEELDENVSKDFVLHLLSHFHSNVSSNVEKEI